jgi:hypothetical protein
VRSEHAERVLAHVIPGVEGVYDRYEYLVEKRDALTKLAALIDRIVHPVDNVIELHKDDDQETGRSRSGGGAVGAAS